MRQYIGSIVSLLLAVGIAIIGAVTHWPWHWWVFVIIVALCLVAAILAYPAPDRPQTAFVVGDASGSKFRNVYSDADDFVRGDARRALFWNVVHLSHHRRRK